MNIIASIKNSSNWELIYRENREVLVDAAGGYIPLPAFEIPITLDDEIIAVRTISQRAKFTWRFAGVLSQRMQLGAGLTSLPVATITSQRIQLNRSELVQLNNFGTDYELLFEPYSWIKNLDVSIWRYIGGIFDKTAIEVTKAFKYVIINQSRLTLSSGQQIDDYKASSKQRIGILIGVPNGIITASLNDTYRSTMRPIRLEANQQFLTPMPYEGSISLLNINDANSSTVDIVEFGFNEYS